MSGFPEVAVAYNPALQYSDLLGWTFDIEGGLAQWATVSAAATLQLVRIPLPAALTVTNMLIFTGGTTGVALTHSYLGIYQSNGTVIGQTADQSTPWTSPYNKCTAALVGGPYACSPLGANDFLWVAPYIGTASTLPTFYGGTGGIGYGFGAAARARQGRYAVADTATLPSIIPANIVMNAVDIWMGLS